MRPFALTPSGILLKVDASKFHAHVSATQKRSMHKIRFICRLYFPLRAHLAASRSASFHAYRLAGGAQRRGDPVGDGGLLRATASRIICLYPVHNEPPYFTV
jgi:hypothetical protein